MNARAHEAAPRCAACFWFLADRSQLGKVGLCRALPPQMIIPPGAPMALVAPGVQQVNMQPVYPTVAEGGLCALFARPAESAESSPLVVS